MELKVIGALDPSNVNIAMLTKLPIISDDTIQILDLSIQTETNQLPAFGDFITTYTDNDGIILFNNESYSTMLTTHYNYIVEFSRRIPLWYKHDLKKLYYNTSGKFEYVTIRNMAPDTYYQLVPSSSNRIICSNTIIAYNNTDAPETPITSISVYDPSEQRIKFNTTLAHDGKEIVVTFYSIEPSYTIYDQENVAANRENIKLKVTKYETTPDATDKFGALTGTGKYLNNIYYASILTNLDTKENTHRIEYKSHDGNVEETVTEIINQLPNYAKVTGTPSAGEYTIAADYKMYVNWPTDLPVFIRFPNSNSKISLLEPDDLPLTKPWYLGLRNDGFTESGLTYQPILSSQAYENRNERAIMISRTAIRTVYKPLHVIRNNENKPQNITILTKGSDVSSYITDVDVENGIIYFSERMPFDPLTTQIYYQRKLETLEYRDLNLNPSMYFNNTTDIMTSKYLVFMLPKEEIVPGKERNIFHVPIYRNPTVAHPYNASLKDVDSAKAYVSDIAVLRTLFPTNIDPLISAVHPLFLGVVTVTNPYTAKALPFKDIRYPGGGIRHIQEASEYLDSVKMHLMDIAGWDGISPNLENVAMVKIPAAIRDNLIELFTYYDTETIRQVRADPTFDVSINVDAYIDRIVRKYLRAGCEYKVTYI